MPRTFNGSAGIFTDLGDVDVSGAYTLVSVFDTTSATDNQYVLCPTGAQTTGIRLNSSGQIQAAFPSASATTPTPVTYSAAEGYTLVAITKSAATSIFRIHKYVFGTGTWTRQSSSTTYASQNDTSSIRHGYGTSITGFLGDIAASAIFGYAMSDGQVTALIDDLDAWLAATPDAMWVFDQASIATDVLDETGGGADESSETGTTSVASNPSPIDWAGGDALAYRAGAAGTSAASSVALTIPATVQTGDQLIAVVTYKLLISTATLNTPAGWSARHSPANGPAGNTFQGAVFTKTVAPGDAGATVTFNASSGTQQLNAALAAYDGVDSIRSSSFTVGSTTASTSVSCPGPGTPPQAGDLVVFYGAVRGSTNGPSSTPTFTAPGGATMRQQSANTSGSAQNTAAFIGDHDDSSGTRTVTASHASWAIAGQIVLIPEPTTVALDRDIADTVTASDAVTRTGGRPRTVADTVTVGEAVGRAAAAVRAVADVVSAADQIGRVHGAARGSSDASEVADSVTAYVNQQSATADTVDVVDGVATHRIVAGTVVDAVAAADAVARVSVHSRSSADSTAVADTVAGLGSAPRTVADTVTAGESVARTAAWPRAVADTVAAGESVARSATGSRAVADGAAVADTASTPGSAARGIADTVQVADAVSKGLGRERDGSDAVGVAAAAGQHGARARAISDAVDVVDSAARASGAPRVVPDSVEVADQAGRVLALLAEYAADELGLSDAAEQAAAAAVAGDDAVEVVDDGGAGQSLSAAISDTVDVAESSARTVVYARSIGDAVHVAVQATVAGVSLRAITDTVQVVDDGVAGRSVAAYTSDTVTAGDTVSRSSARAAGFSDTVSAGDAAGTIRELHRAGADNVDLEDVVGRAVVFARQLAAALGLVAVAAGPRNTARGVADAVHVSDTAVGGSGPGIVVIIASHTHITVTSRPATVRDTTSAASVRRTI